MEIGKLYRNKHTGEYKLILQVAPGETGPFHYYVFYLVKGAVKMISNWSVEYFHLCHEEVI